MKEITFGVYIDADNVSAEMTDKALELLVAQGRIRHIAAYGNWTSKSSAWRTISIKYNIHVSHMFSLARGKNSADMKLVVDAMVAMEKPCFFNTLVVMSGDSDFIPLIQHARKCGIDTIGIGASNASLNYARACDNFLFFENSDCVHWAKDARVPIGASAILQ